MTTHDKDQKDQLSSTQKLATKSAQQYFTSVRHTMHVGISQLELAKNVSCIRSYQAEAYDEDQSPIQDSQAKCLGSATKPPKVSPEDVANKHSRNKAKRRHGRRKR